MKDSDTIFAYIKKLKFDKKLRTSFVAKYLTNFRLVFLLILTILVLGITSFIKLPRQLNPKVDIAYVNVVTVLPGASPEDMESLVTVPIEDAVKDVDKLENLTSSSQENLSLVTLEFSAGTDSAKAKSDVQALVDTVDSLPEDAETPHVAALDFEDQPILVYTVTTEKGKSSLQAFAENLRQGLESIQGIDRVSVSGIENEEVEVLISEQKLENLGLDIFALSENIKLALKSLPLGNLKEGSSNFTFSIEKGVFSVADLRSLPISVSGEIMPLGNVAEVSIKPMSEEKSSFHAENGDRVKPAIVLSIFKEKNEDIEEVAQKAQEYLDREIAISAIYKGSVTQNAAKEITDQFQSLGINFAETVILVFITLFLFLGLRQALIVSLSIPLTFLVSFTVMSAVGITLNFLSTFSLLLGLGLLVDDAIVITSAMTTYYKSGKFSPEETGLLVWRDFIVPIWTTTITTVWAFVPLLLSTGIIGAFIKSIPIVVSATLLGSTAVAVLITLPSMIVLLDLKAPKRIKIAFWILLPLILLSPYAFIPKSPLVLYLFSLTCYLIFLGMVFAARAPLLKFITKRIPAQGVINTEKLVGLYATVVQKILVSKGNRRKIIVMVVAFSIFSYALLPLGFVVNEFFPKTNSDLVFLNIKLPVGSTLSETENKTLQVLSNAKNVTGVKSALAEVGKLTDQGDGAIGGNHTARITLKLDKEDSIGVAKTLRKEFEGYNDSEVSVIELSGGPPAGLDVQIKYLGDDLEVLDTLANKTMDYLKAKDGVINVVKSSPPGASRVVFAIDDTKALENGVGRGQISLAGRIFTSGLKLADAKLVETGKDEVEVKLRSDSSTKNVSDLPGLYIQSSKGPVPLLALGSLSLKENPSIIARENGKRSISVSASVESGYSISQINKDLQSFADTLNLEASYSWQTGGVNEENNESVASIMQAMALSALLILATMVIQLGSFRKSIIVLMVIPLAISGVFIVFALTKTPLSFPSLIGVLALFGIVVNNSIMLVEKINQNLKIKIPFLEALVDAAGSRVEPILFSSLTTIIGLIPITLSDPLWRGLGGAIIAGLSVSGIIMLFFIPVVYYSWYAPKEKVVSRS